MPPSANSLYTQLLLTSGGISFVIMLTAWKRRHGVSSALPIALYSLSNVIWSWTYAVHWSTAFRPSEFFWLDMTYFGVVLSAPMLLIFACSYTGLRAYLTRRWIARLFVIPVLTLIVLWSDPLHGLFFHGQRVHGASVIFSGGIGFWLNALFLYCCVLVAILVLMQAFFHSPRRYFGQMGVILVGVSLPLTANLLAFSGTYPLPGLDMTPLVFSMTGLFLALAMVRYDFLDIMPISRKVIFDINTHAFVIWDRKKRVVDVNESFKTMFAYHDPAIVGKDVHGLSAQLPCLPHPSFEKDGETLDFCLEQHTKRCFTLAVYVLRKEQHGIDGYIWSISDVTKEKAAEAALRAANDALKAQLAHVALLQEKLRAEALQDPLTGLYNRRYLHEIVHHALPQAERTQSTVAFVLFDVDSFKQLNDQYGHAAGDDVLRAFSTLVQEQTRKGDFVFRFGGEEFLLVIAGAARDAVARRVEGLRQIVEAHHFGSAETRIRVTVSAGIATFPEDGRTMDTLLKVADRRLYWAKATGRNRIGTWCDETHPVS